MGPSDAGRKPLKFGHHHIQTAASESGRPCRWSVLKVEDRRFSDTVLQICASKSYLCKTVIIWCRSGRGPGYLAISAGISWSAAFTCPCSCPNIHGCWISVVYSICFLLYYCQNVRQQLGHHITNTSIYATFLTLTNKLGAIVQFLYWLTDGDVTS